MGITKFFGVMHSVYSFIFMHMSKVKTANIFAEAITAPVVKKKPKVLMPIKTLADKAMAYCENQGLVPFIHSVSLRTRTDSDEQFFVVSLSGTINGKFLSGYFNQEGTASFYIRRNSADQEKLSEARFLELVTQLSTESLSIKF